MTTPGRPYHRSFAFSPSPSPLRSGFSQAATPLQQQPSLPSMPEDENTPPDPNNQHDFLRDDLYTTPRKPSTPSVATITSSPGDTPRLASSLRYSMHGGNNNQVALRSSVPSGSGDIRLRADPSLLTTFDPKDKELHDLWVGRLQ